MALGDLTFQPVTIRRASYSATGGERTPTWVEVAGSMAIQPMSAKTKTDHGLDQSDSAYALYSESDPAVRVRDQIVWSGRTLIVLGKAMDQAGLGRLFKVAAREID
jgi:hypothetical protein